jgi:beta-glucanase (GH16 family)
MSQAIEQAATIIAAVLTATSVPKDTANRVLAILQDVPDPNDDISEAAAAKLLGCSGMTLLRWRRGERNKRFPFRRVRLAPTGRYIYSKAEVLEYRDNSVRFTKKGYSNK